MTKTGRVGFLVGSWACLVTAAAHLAGHFAGSPPPQNEKDKALQDLMAGYVHEIAGTRLTMAQLVHGFSLSFSVFMTLWGLQALMLARQRALPDGVLRTAARLYVLVAAALLAIGLLHFPLPPTICFAVILAAFMAPAVVRAA